MKRYTLAQIMDRGVFCIGDIDILVKRKLATFGRKSGKTTLTMDLFECEGFITEMREQQRRWR